MIDTEMKKKGLNSKAIFMKRKIFGLLLVAIVGVLDTKKSWKYFRLSNGEY